MESWVDCVIGVSTLPGGYMIGRRKGGQAKRMMWTNYQHSRSQLGRGEVMNPGFLVFFFGGPSSDGSPSRTNRPEGGVHGSLTFLLRGDCWADPQTEWTAWGGASGGA